MRAWPLRAGGAGAGRRRRGAGRVRRGAGRAGRPGSRRSGRPRRPRGRWPRGPAAGWTARCLGPAEEEPRRGTARFAEGVKCLKYGGGSERRGPPHPAAARGHRSLPRRAPPRRPTPGGWKFERKPESCPLRRRGFSLPGAGPGSVAGETTPRRPAGSSLTGKKFARIAAGSLRLLREVAGGRQRGEPHLVWQQPRCREKIVKGAFPFVSKRKFLFLL